MSVSLYQGNVQRLMKEKADLEKQVSQQTEKIAKLSREIYSLKQAIARSTSPTTIRMKQRQLEAREKELVGAQNKLAEIDAKLARKIGDLSRNQRNLERVQEQLGKQKQAKDKKHRDEDLKHAKHLTDELKRQKRLASQPPSLGSVDTLPRDPAVGTPLHQALHVLSKLPPQRLGGRPSNPDDDWAWEQVHIHKRPPKEVRSEWIERIGERADLLADIERSWRHVIKPNRKRRKKPE